MATLLLAFLIHSFAFLAHSVLRNDIVNEEHALYQRVLRTFELIAETE